MRALPADCLDAARLRRRVAHECRRYDLAGMGSEVLIGQEWVRVEEGTMEIMDALEQLEHRQTSNRLRDRWVPLTMSADKRPMKVAPQVIHGVRELAA